MKRTILALFLLLGHALYGQEKYPFQAEVKGSGPAVILIPGMSSGGGVWDASVARLSLTHECHVLTLAGFAGEPAVEGPFVATMREGIARYIREKKIDRPVLVGHSLGAFLALSIAATYPDLPGAVVAVDGVPFAPALMDGKATAASVEPMAKSMSAMLAGSNRDQFAAQTKMSMQMMITGKDDLEREVARAVRSDPAAVAKAFYELMTVDIRPDMKKVRVPLLMIAAGASATTPEMLEGIRSTYEQQIEAVSDHRVIVAEKARHFVMLDSPEWFHATLATFLEATAASAGAR